MKKIALLALAGTAFAALPASAATLYSNPSLISGAASPGSASFSVLSAGGCGALNFNIDGFNTLDGINYYEDDFTLNVNGSDVLQLSYDLGGGGSNSIFTNTVGAVVSGGTFGFGSGGQLKVSIGSLALLAGNNTFTFSYASPSGGSLGDPFNGHAGEQGTGDESFGISDVVLTGPAAVPEPATWAMMIAGFGIVGASMRRRQRTTVRYAA